MSEFNWLMVRGARATRKLIEKIILSRFSSSVTLSDAAIVTPETLQLAVSTDSHTVTPLFFPGGDIGRLSVIGTVNDLAVTGALPQWITLSLIIEEGLPFSILEAVLDSVASAADECAVKVVAGDTKVVPRGMVDHLFINTTGIGQVSSCVPPGPSAIQKGDIIIASGSPGRHGIAVLCARDELKLLKSPRSDCANVYPAVHALLETVGPEVRCIRDATRGGFSAVLHEWSAEQEIAFQLNEDQVPLTNEVRGVCELLGLDPLYVANEGTFLAVVSADAATLALKTLQRIDVSFGAAAIGTVRDKGPCPVTIQRGFGSPQPLDEPTGAPLPRIC